MPSGQGHVEVDTYKVRWWGTLGSKMSQPLYRVAQIDSGRVKLRYCLVQGRPLSNYTLPYWPIRSFVSMVDSPAELAHACCAKTPSGEMPFIRGPKHLHNHPIHGNPPWGCFELASEGGTKVLRITNEGSDSLVLMEQYFTVSVDDPIIPIHLRATNLGEETISGFELRTSYQQGFNWSLFLESKDGSYTDIEGQMGEPWAFLAFSAGMRRGYGFVAGRGCHLSYRLSSRMNAWQVDVTSSARRIKPGGCTELAYLVYCLHRPSANPPSFETEEGPSPFDLTYRRIKPHKYRSAGVQLPANRRGPLLADLQQPKVRGLNLVASYPQALVDIEQLKEWGCNLLITGSADPDQTRAITSMSHQLGMEVLVSGTGRNSLGAPSFEALNIGSLKADERPDSFGQDEDHYYWSSVEPMLDFQSFFGKSMDQATQMEKVVYWSKCFAERWRRLRDDLRTSHPEAGIWFYTPSPSIANIDPLDYYDQFMMEMGSLGQSLTVLPFYYGVEYSQAEYMVKRWKDNSACRVVFLTMRDFMDRPSQYFRAIAAARRGGADGACGFSFSVGESEPERAWQWKSVMLAAQALFPTPELSCFCLMEEPAEMLEALAGKEVVVRSKDLLELLPALDELLPLGAVQGEVNGNPGANRLCLVSGRLPSAEGTNLPTGQLDFSKGMISMEGNRIYLQGRDEKGLHNAMNLLLRFAELAGIEGKASR